VSPEGEWSDQLGGASIKLVHPDMDQMYKVRAPPLDQMSYGSFAHIHGLARA
jgi:hypothetical protein